MTLSEELRRARLAGDNPDAEYLYGLIDRAAAALSVTEIAPSLCLLIEEIGTLDDDRPGVVLRGSMQAVREAAKLLGDPVVLVAARGGRDE